METIEQAGVPDARRYIRFYNLRNYDRIQANDTMANVEAASGVNYEDARREHDDLVGAGYDGRGEETGAVPGRGNERYDRYQEEAAKVENSEYDTVSSSTSQSSVFYSEYLASLCSKDMS